MSDWIDLGPLGEFPEGTPVLRKSGTDRFVCVRRGGVIHALDDRCPHQGYPLSQGCVSEGILTCEWHNWKFDLQNGDCLFGGEPVRHYPTRVNEGRVELDRSLDLVQTRTRLEAGLRRALVDDDAARALREALRLGALAPTEAMTKDGHGLGDLGDLGAGFALLARDGAERAEYGFDHGLALLADLCSWVERGWLDSAAAFATAATAVAEPSRHLGPRPIPAREVTAPEDISRVAEDLLAERREDAEARVRHLVRTHGAEHTGLQALLPFVSRHFYDYGHGAIFLAKALELARRFPAAVEPLLAAATVELGWATAETALPPFASTQQALAELGTLRLAPRGTGFDRKLYEAEVLAGERTAVQATYRALAEGCDPVALLRAAGHAAAVRLLRFDRAWERRLDAEVGVLDVTHAVTYIEAAIALGTLGGDGTAQDAARMAIIGAGVVGKLRRADRPESTLPEAARAPATLLEAVRARDVQAALALAGHLDRAGRLAVYQELAPFAAFEAAVRPIFYAHTVKTCEALRRLESGDPGADGAYLQALLGFLVPPQRERNFPRTGAIARKFLADGRPPEALF
jgi:nitrite reductase/ring-hydroxylating ferredoxin subunit